jgi:hypothetical protein
LGAWVAIGRGTQPLKNLPFEQGVLAMMAAVHGEEVACPGSVGPPWPTRELRGRFVAIRARSSLRSENLLEPLAQVRRELSAKAFVDQPHTEQVKDVDAVNIAKRKQLQLHQFQQLERAVARTDLGGLAGIGGLVGIVRPDALAGEDR